MDDGSLFNTLVNVASANGDSGLQSLTSVSNGNQAQGGSSGSSSSSFGGIAVYAGLAAGLALVGVVAVFVGVHKAHKTRTFSMKVDSAANEKDTVFVFMDDDGVPTEVLGDGQMCTFGPRQNITPPLAAWQWDVSQV